MSSTLSGDWYSCRFTVIIIIILNTCLNCKFSAWYFIFYCNTNLQVCFYSVYFMLFCFIYLFIYLAFKILSFLQFSVPEFDLMILLFLDKKTREIILCISSLITLCYVTKFTRSQFFSLGM